MSLFALVYWIPLVKALTDIQFNDLSTPLTTYCFAGMGAIYNKKIYAIHGGRCEQKKDSSGNCDRLEDRTPVTYTLDLSGIVLSGTNNKIISLSNDPFWREIIPGGIATNPNFTKTKGGYQPSGYAYVDGYSWAIYPSINILVSVKSIMRYDMHTNSYTQQSGPYDSWIELTPLGHKVLIDTCNAHHANYLYSIGGFYKTNDTNYATNEIWRLNMNTSDWDAMTSMPTARQRLSCAVINGSIYALGGLKYVPSKTVVDIIEEYVIASDTWLKESYHNNSMSVARQQHVSHAHPNKQWIITLGGRASDPNNVNVPIEIFEPLTHRVYATDIMYWQRFFYSTIYHLNSDVSIIWAYGGYLNQTYFKEVKYMVLHTNDHIPSWSPTKYPTVDPTYSPTYIPTTDPTENPSTTPTKYPTKNPTISPTKGPTPAPTTDPTAAPTDLPTPAPTDNPSMNPTFMPTSDPTTDPTRQPTTTDPTISPTKYPTIGPTLKPTKPPLEANDTYAPSDSPTNEPTTAEPSITPSRIPTRSYEVPTLISNEVPTLSPHQEGGISDTTTTQVITSDEADVEGQQVLDTSPVDNLNSGVNYFMITLIGFCTFFMIISFVANRLVYTGCDPPNFFALLWVIMELYDFFSDISFSVYLWYLKDTHGSQLLTIFVVASIFIYLPYLLNLIYLSIRIRKWKTKLRRSAIGEWLAYWDWWLICLSMLSGGSHPAVEICNSLLFPMDAFGMHLPWTEIVRIRTERFCTTVLFENVPQLCIQLYLLASIQVVGGNSIIYLTILSSVGSIAFSGLYYFVNQHKVKVSQNHWIFRMRLTSNNIAEHHKHSYYKLQVAISKSLEIPNVEWVRLTSVQQKADELRCDGFISIPDQYLKKKKRKPSDDPKKQKEMNDMRRASEMYRNTFDEIERNEFINRLEAAKEEESHYHKTLVKQLQHDIKLFSLKVEFEIGGGNREGVGDDNKDEDNDNKNKYNKYNENKGPQPIPIIHFAPEGDEMNNTFLNNQVNNGPGNSYQNNNDNLIEMANMINHQVYNEKVKDTPGNSKNNSPFNVSYVDKALLDDEVDNIHHVENENNDGVAAVAAQHVPMRTDDGMIEQMIDEEFTLTGKAKHTPKKSQADIVDEEIMAEMEMETLNDGEIIDAELNGINDVDVDAIIGDGTDLIIDFNIDTIQ